MVLAAPGEGSSNLKKLSYDQDQMLSSLVWAYATTAVADHRMGGLPLE